MLKLPTIYELEMGLRTKPNFWSPPNGKSESQVRLEILLEKNGLELTQLQKDTLANLDHIVELEYKKIELYNQMRIGIYQKFYKDIVGDHNGQE